MREYFYTIIITSVLGSLCSFLGEGGFEKYTKYIGALIAAAVIILPIGSIDISSVTEEIKKSAEEISVPESQNLNNLSQKMTEERAEEYICQIVFSQLGITPLFCRINIDWNKKEPIIENITVGLLEEDMDSAEEVENYLYRALGGEVKVIEG